MITKSTFLQDENRQLCCFIKEPQCPLSYSLQIFDNWTIKLAETLTLAPNLWIKELWRHLWTSGIVQSGKTQILALFWNGSSFCILRPCDVSHSRLCSAHMGDFPPEFMENGLNGPETEKRIMSGAKITWELFDHTGFGRQSIRHMCL